MSETQDFLFVDLQQALVDGKPFVGFAPNVDGPFIDFRGREIEITPEEIEKYLANTLQRIADMQEKGMDGLPVDSEKHDKGKAAGWLVDAELGEVTTSGGQTVPVIRFYAKWTKLGQELIADRVMTNFSPTFDTDEKMVVGGSLTNWPASVDERDIPLFNAVELSQGVHYLEEAEQERDETGEEQPENELETGDEPMPEKDKDTKPDRQPEKEPTLELTQERLDELVSERVQAALAELDEQRAPDGELVELGQLVEAFGLDTDEAEEQQIKHLEQLAEMVEQQANLRWQQKLAKMQRQNTYAELAQRVTGGTPDAPRGFPAEADTIRDELLKLEPERAKFWSGLLETTVKHGLTEFNELGHSRQVEQRRDVPDYARDIVRKAVANEADLNEVFLAAGLGEADQYDLSEFEESNNG